MRIPSRHSLAWPALSTALLACIVTGPLVSRGAHAATRGVRSGIHTGGASDGKRLTNPAQPSQPVKAEGQLGPGKGTLYIGLEPPAGAKLTAGSPVVIEAEGAGLKFPEKLKARMEPGSPVAVPVEVDESSPGKAKIKLSYYWCHASDSGQCVREHADLAVLLDLSGDSAGGEAFFSYRARGK